MNTGKQEENILRLKCGQSIQCTVSNFAFVRMLLSDKKLYASYISHFLYRHRQPSINKKANH